MKSHFSAALCAMLAALSFGASADAQLPPAMAELPPQTEAPAHREARMAWWREAKSCSLRILKTNIFHHP
jgi:hypothetical protein